MRLFFKLLFRGFYKFLTNSDQREFMRLVFLYGDKKRYEKTVVKFLNYKFHVADCLSFIWQFKEIFVDEAYKFETKNVEPVIYDCGANIGLSCLYLKNIFPDSRIKAFEADPNIAKILSSNLNDLKKVEVINKAVWINDEGVEISLEGADAASIYGSKNKVKVDSVSLNKLIENEEKIDMLKVDIEGAEVDVIKDCKESLHKVENIFIEYHSFLNYPQDLDSILKILKEKNFRYFIKQPADRNSPLLNRFNKNYPEMDLQLNIFAYKLESN
jgi:FkbM family methyltransferase